nr:putative ribonuclease H-like domain-containing protein [Tanacetum cinerariifolium]
MLADLLLPIPFWAEAVNTACYVQNRVLVTKPHNKTPYELLHGKTPSIAFMRPFGCPVTILNILDSLGKFDRKVDEGFLVGYSVSSKAFRVFNSRIRIVQETLHVNFLENKPNNAGSGHTWLFDIDNLTKTMNYQPVNAGNQTNLSAGLHDKFDAEKAKEEVDQQYVFFLCGLLANAVGTLVPTVGQNSPNITNIFNAAGPSNAATSPTHGKSSLDASQLPYDPDMLELEDITYSDDEYDVGAEVDFNNLETSITVSPILTTRVHKDNHVTQIISDLSLTTQTRSMTRVVKDQGGLSQINNDDFHTYMFAYFLSQEEPKRVHQALKDPSWIKAMQEELLQFKMQKVWILVDLPHGKRTIGTKWVFRNKKDERGIVIRNKARLVVQGHIQEEGTDFEEVFDQVARIEAIRLFLAYASFMGFMVYQINVKSAFLYGSIEEEVYVCQPPGFEDPDYPNKVYKVVKALYGLHQAPRAWYETLANYILENDFQRGKIDQTLFIKRQKGDILLVQIYVDDIIFGATNKDLYKSFEKLMKDKFQMSSMRELAFFLGLQVKQKKDRIFISQDKYVAEILKKFGLTEGKSASTPIDTEKPLLKDSDGEDVDVHTYRSMIGSLMYLTSLRPDIMFAVCACVHFQVTPKASYLYAVKRIFRYLKGKPHLGLWYLKDSPFDLVAYSDSDYAGASLDRKSTTRGCQFLSCRLIFWQCNKQIVVATSSTKAEYVVAASCCAQVLWIQNQLLDYGSIKYALTVNPNIYVSFIKQFWTTVAVKQVNDVTRLQALVDKKKVVILEATIQEALRLDDEEGVDCLSNEEIFAELARMGYEKPSTKITFYKAFFSSQWKVGKGFSGVKTPLFEGMLVAQEVRDEGADEVLGAIDNDEGAAERVVSVADDVVPTVDAEPSIPSPTPPTPPPQPS